MRQSGRTELRNALARNSGALIGVALFSAVINVLMLTGPLFMLQVYDRVLASRSSATLLVLFAIVLFLYAMMGLLDHVRGRVLARVGARVEQRLEARIYDASLTEAETQGPGTTALRDLTALRTALASPAMGAIFDLPWAPLFIAVMFILHPWLGWFSVGGAALVLILALWSQARTRRPLAEAAEHAQDAETRAETARAAVETVRGLGMNAPLAATWHDRRGGALSAAMRAADGRGGIASATKTIRMGLQSAVLALGALLALRGDLTPGAMIAGSILLGRALAPIEQSVGHWPQIERARRGWSQLRALLDRHPQRAAPMPLPPPEARLDVKDLYLLPNGGGAPILSAGSFSAAPGDAIAVIGPSGSGKSSLARALAGLWHERRGEIRLSGAEVVQYDRDTLGRALGYLPQDVTLFPGTVAQNVARFDPAAAPAAIVTAAQVAGAHDLILSLPDGYDTRVGPGGWRPSGGQRQRIGLARAFFGDPVLMVLDEPNANLDEPGLIALNRAIAAARAAGQIVFVMSHRPSALAECNLVILLEGGRLRAMGPRDDVLTKYTRTPPGVRLATPPAQVKG
ncbi:type I secretion system permease/ATPase [Anianabacter salinae]|uniref:type I secretion system permease/ATPase n=1 Tax=Anianabacter salinae TaxID=2851023 RepID=UPI00225DDC28|nr:type I secretion system permease/ATPase [Anianabacter salinae]MBV0912167.1 type I secretion system permease/ATPase [Anianabacter salinae]